MYQAPYRNNSKTHGAMCHIKQFPLKLAWGSTAHKVQGITIKRGTNIVIHGHANIPDSMYYLMLGRAQEMEQVYLQMPKVKGKTLRLKIRANRHSLEENEKLVKRSIVSSFKEQHFSIFMVNVNSLQNKITDLTKDLYAQMSDHICVVETWISPSVNYNLDITGRAFQHASYGRGKGCGIFSLASRQLNSIKKVSKEQYQMMSIVDETVPSYPYQLILVYASNCCTFPEMVIDLKGLLQQNTTTIVIGDFNFDKKEKNALTKYLGEKGFSQIIDWPTHQAGRTIDHCYVSKNTRVHVTRHSPYFSDHDALCIQFEHFPW